MARQHILFLMEEIHKLKEYKEETFFTAVSLADRYLVYLSVSKCKPPCFIKLAIVCCLIAAKMDQPISPSFKRMVRLVKREWDVEIELSSLIDLEERMLRVLDLSIHNTSPIIFLDRYLRLFGVDNVEEDEDDRQVSQFARRLVKTFVNESSNLNFKPSDIAASALLASLNICDSHLAEEIGLKRVLGLSQKSEYHDPSLILASPLKVGRLRRESSRTKNSSSTNDSDPI